MIRMRRRRTRRKRGRTSGVPKSDRESGFGDEVVRPTEMRRRTQVYERRGNPNRPDFAFRQRRSLGGGHAFIARIHY